MFSFQKIEWQLNILRYQTNIMYNFPLIFQRKRRNSLCRCFSEISACYEDTNRYFSATTTHNAYICCTMGLGDSWSKQLGKNYTTPAGEKSQFLPLSTVGEATSTKPFCWPSSSPRLQADQLSVGGHEQPPISPPLTRGSSPSNWVSVCAMPYLHEASAPWWLSALRHRLQTELLPAAQAQLLSLYANSSSAFGLKRPSRAATSPGSGWRLQRHKARRHQPSLASCI